MPYTTPRTWADGQLVTAAQLNTDVRDNVGFAYNVATGSTRNALANASMYVSTMNYPSAEWSGGGNYASTGQQLPSWFDRWYFYTDYGSLATVGPSQSGTTYDTPPGVPSPYSMVYKVVTGGTPTANQVAGFGQVLYTDETYRLGLGVSGNRPLVLSFWVKSSVTGTYTVSLFATPNNGSSGGFVSGSYTVLAANTWEFKTITFPNVPSGSSFWQPSATYPDWLGYTAMLAIRWGLGAGTTYNAGSLNTTWSTSAATGTRYAGQTNFMATAGNTIKIAAPQLEQGTEATPFQGNNPVVDYAVTARQIFCPRGEIFGRAISGSQIIATINLPFFALGNSYYPALAQTNPMVFIADSDTGGFLGSYNVSSVANVRNPANNVATTRFNLTTAPLTTGRWYVLDQGGVMPLIMANSGQIWFNK